MTMKITDEMIKFVQGWHESLIRFAPDHGGIFKSVLTIVVEGEKKPLLLVGNAHSGAKDGECVVILNPSKSLTNALNPGVAYLDLKENVTDECDAMVHLWFDHYKRADQCKTLSSYEARKFRKVEISAGQMGVCFGIEP